MRKTAHFNSAVTFVMALFLLLAGVTSAAEMAPFQPVQDVPTAPDYTDKSAWLTLPDDPSKHPADVFWVYPTILFDKTHWLMPVSDQALITAAAQTLRTQASVFSDHANIFAPLYRQMNIAALALPERQLGEMLAYGKEDVLNAFRYYLKHFNQGRPFILAGHSQGSDILTELAVEHWGTFGVESRLIAAYTIGWSITPKDLEKNPNLDICTEALKTGCFITYNTVAPGRQSVAPTLSPGTHVVNPLTWTTSTSPASASLNKGAVFFPSNSSTQTIPQYAGAQIIDHGLVIDPEDKSPLINGGAFPQGVYHAYDYSIFYENLRHNAGQRIEAFLGSQQ